MKIERLYPIWFVLCASAGAIIGRMTGDGIIRGLIAGMLVAALPLFLLVLVNLLLMLWRPNLPTCSCRQCNQKGYRYIDSADGHQTGVSVRFGCPRCGRLYELSRDRFNELTNDGRTIPYMYHTKWGRWKEAKAEQSPAVNVAGRTVPEK